MVLPQGDEYRIALKTFLRKGKEILLCKDIEGKWDLPGGRIESSEFDLAFEKILEREIKEELGNKLHYKNNGLTCIFRHRRKEISLRNKPEIKILMLGFELKYLSGEITLSDEHSEYQWLSLDDAITMLKNGQLIGLKKYCKYLQAGKRRIIY